jgi:hypothetical protein
MDKEMNDVRVVFKLHNDDQPIPVGYQMICTHIIYNVKMEDFRRKARCVAGGHMTEVPSTITYASVVSRESMMIALTLAATYRSRPQTSRMHTYAPHVLIVWFSKRQNTVESSMCCNSVNPATPYDFNREAVLDRELDDD